MTHQYELMVILDPEIDERTVAPSLDKFLNVIRNDGGTIDNVDIWGRRRLAYEINKKTEGIYAVVALTADGDTTNGRARPPAEAQRSGHAHQGASRRGGDRPGRRGRQAPRTRRPPARLQPPRRPAAKLPTPLPPAEVAPARLPRPRPRRLPPRPASPSSADADGRDEAGVAMAGETVITVVGNLTS